MKTSELLALADKLLNEVEATLSLAVPCIGNTNAAVLRLRASEAAAALRACDKALRDGTHSHVDGRDLLAELKPNGWHFCDIRVRINGQWQEYEGDWLKRLFRLRNSALNEITPNPWQE